MSTTITTTTAPPQTWLDKAKAWLQQSTSGQGASIIIAAITGLSTGAITHSIFYAMMAAGVFLIIFPQANSAKVVAAMQTIIPDVELLGQSYMAGHKNGETLGKAAVGALPMIGQTLSDLSPLVAALDKNTAATLVSASAVTAAAAVPDAPASTPVPPPVFAVGAAGIAT